MASPHWIARRGSFDVDRSTWIARRGRGGPGPVSAYLLYLLDKSVTNPEAEEISKWSDLRRRAWTNLCNHYTEIRAGAAYVHRNDPGRLERYPSFYSHPRKK